MNKGMNVEKKQDVLDLFHPLVAGWFRDKIGEPTDIQALGWGMIAEGAHVLITAPTGSGKTLTAFLWALNQWARGAMDLGRTSILYISPLKALNNDIRRNLLRPLEELGLLFQEENQSFPHVRVMTRSGDTPQPDRRAMQRHPPEILITTPESLNLLLSSLGGRSILTGIETVILDEIHEVLGTKRGVHLITAVERLVPLSGEFQRIALSATINPLETAAAFIGGFRMEGSRENPRYVPRDVKTVASSTEKSYDILVRSPEGPADFTSQESAWKPIVRELKEIIGRNRSTLIFTNSRRLCEKLTLKINQDEASPLAYAHHGSLSREIRTEVEGKLKSGDLKAIVATNSLELGIDIGRLDEVVLIQSPPSLSSAIQRVGRAGHQVGGTSRGTLFPTHDLDLLEAAVVARGILSRDMAPTGPIQCPLDVLAQIIVSMVAVETWDMDDLFAQLRTSAPYRDLTRTQFDLVMNMLAGRFADTRVRELKPRISIDRLDNTVSARRGALMALYMSGGVIPDRGYFHMRHMETNALIGDLDEEFVWEARIGQIFALGAQNWRIERITHSDVFVMPAPPRSMSAPFWKGEGINRDFHFSERIGLFMEEADNRLDDPGFSKLLERDHCMEKGSIDRLLGFLKRQKEAAGRHLPHRHHLLVESVSSGPGGVPGTQAILHTLWGGRVNRPFAMALDAAWEMRFGHRLEIFAGNDCVALLLPHDTEPEELLSLVTSSNVMSLLRKRLEGSGFFGARFRECAGRALLLTRQRFNERLPLWISRLRSKKLLESVMSYEDFPILLEAWRSCLQDEFDMEALVLLLSELESGVIQWSWARTSGPSPIARSITWRQINEYMYMDDTPSTGKGSNLRGDLLRDLVFTPGLRPVVSRDVIDRFELKRQRLAPGYGPSSERDLLDWVKERVIIPRHEWDRLMEAMRRDHGDAPDGWVSSAGEKIIEVRRVAAGGPLIVSLERAVTVLGALYGDMDALHMRTLSTGEGPHLKYIDEKGDGDENGEDQLVSILGEWLQYCGPRSFEELETVFGIEKSRLRAVLEDLLDAEKLVTGRLSSGGGDKEVCDSENFEYLLRLSRLDSLPEFEPLDIDSLPLFLSLHQGIGQAEGGVEGTARSLEPLLCYPQPAHRWESEILPARMHNYQTPWLDSLMGEKGLMWTGSGKMQVSFCFDSDLDLMHEEGNDVDRPDRPTRDLPVPDTHGRYDFSTLLGLTGLRPQELADRLWEGVWKGEIVNDTFLALRRGIETGFKAAIDTGHSRARRAGRGGSGRRAFSRWRNSLPFAGNWFRLSRPESEGDLLEREERNRDRVRLLLDRYGIIFRELLQRESPPFQWASLFRSIRLMEFSGEIMGGYFFKGIQGPQFISLQAFRRLHKPLPGSLVWWINATDPASPCGLALKGLKDNLPKRVEGNHLVYQGRRLVMISGRRGRDLIFFIPPDDPLIQSALGPLHHLLTRSFQPLRRLVVETINGERASKSPYVEAFRIAFDLSVDYRHVILYRRSQGALPSN